MGSIRAQRYPYRPNPLLPHERRGEIGPWLECPVGGHLFPEIYAIETDVGRVDGRCGAVVDLDYPNHEMVPNNINYDLLTPNGR